MIIQLSTLKWLFLKQETFLFTGLIIKSKDVVVMKICKKCSQEKELILLFFSILLGLKLKK